MADVNNDGSITDLEIYKQQSARFQDLNDTLYRIPPIFSTVIGGLWYLAINQPSHMIVREGILLFSASVGLAGGNALMQLRLAINGYLDQIDRFEKAYAINLKTISPPRSNFSSKLPRVSTVRGLAYLLFLSSVLSIAGMVFSPFGYP